MASLYIPSYLLVVASSVVYALSLIFSNAGKRPWLMTAGIVVLVGGVVLLSAVIWSMNPPDASKNILFEKIAEWTVRIVSFVPVLFIFNFLNERKGLKQEQRDSLPPPQRTLETSMYVVGIIAIVATLFLAQKIDGESYWAIDWKNKAPERAKQLSEPFEARKFVSSRGDTLRYRLMRPVEYDSAKKYPLVVCLNHGGTHGTDNMMQIDGAQAAQVLYQNRTRYPAFLFVPQCPQGASWGGIANYPSIDSLVFEGISALENEFQIDEKRRYVTGISGGGFGSWHFIGTRPGMFAAAIPVCGIGDPKLAQNMTDVAIWAFHGEHDRSVPVSGSRDVVKAIRDAGGDPKYTEFPGAGHNIWEQVNATPGLMDWLFEQKRD